MDDEQRRSRTRGLWLVRLVTAGTVGAALALTWGFGVLAEAFFSGKPPAPPPAPKIPVAAVPVQQPRPVVVTVVQHPGPPPGYVSTAPQPPGSAPGAAPAPPPPPVCHATPSKPC
ncbi:MAG TPA: hypothetical protein VFK22_03340 [Candidatus Dormibacteraeota bacterium]|nr:hypothetical protein [Candidatus Dormibacteraeota bacterium]